MKPRARTIAIGIALVALTWCVFGRTLGFDFVGYDDAAYVTENSAINRGLTITGLTWAFTHFHSSNWHPLTWISHMIDCQLFGLHASGHHFVNVLLHCGAVLLLFLVLNSMTGRWGSSAVVAALFAAHPLHVESVAWVAERKDVLSGVFFVSILAAYTRYTRSPSIGRYVVLLAAFACGLMTKPMLVSVPIVLLLLDFWPLGQMAKRGMWRCVLEKMPLGLFALASSIVTLFAQRNAISSNELLPFWSRVALAPVAVAIYLRQTFWPAKLAVFYPLSPEDVSSAVSFWCAAGLVIISAIAVAVRKRHPYFLTGWFWFLAMLLPVCGLVQVGSQAHADRYTYLPHIGLFLAIVWLLSALALEWKVSDLLCAAAATIFILILAAFAWRQCHYWRNAEVLWQHTLSVTSRNSIAHNNYALALARTGREDEAVAHLEEAIAIRPSYEHAQYNLANALLNRGKIDDAIEHYQAALAAAPDFVPAIANLGGALLQKDEIAAAADLFRRALALNPAHTMNHYNLAVALDRLGQLEEAIREYEEALRFDPDDPEVHENLANALQRTGHQTQAEQHRQAAAALRAQMKAPGR